MDAPDTADVFHAFSEVKNENWLLWERQQSDAFKAYRKKWVDVPAKLEVLDGPMHLDIEMSSRCNLKCTFCARTVRVEAGIWREIRDIEPDLFKKIVDDSIVAGVYALNLNILGEPLLHRDLPDLVRYAKDVGILDVFFHTNAVLLDDRRGRGLIESGLDKLIISFDSPYKEKYEEVRVGADYDSVLQNVKDFCELKKRMGTITPVTRINFIKLPDMLPQEVDDLVQLFSPIVDSIGLLEYVDPSVKELVSIKRKENRDSDRVSGFVCPQVLTRLTVYEDGRTFPCCMDYDDELQLGDLNEKTVSEIWNSKKLRGIRKLHLEGKYYKIPACAKCDFAIKGDRECQG